VDAADVPPRVVTVTSTVPDPEGLTAVISVEETTLTLVAAVDPKSTQTGELKLVPLMVTAVDPASEPSEGLTDSTEGADNEVEM
jgi:hypothetical protein